MMEPPFKCSICGKEYPIKGYRLQHMRNVHLLNAKGNPISEHSCLLCEKKFKRKFALKAHVEKVHSMNDDKKKVVYNCDKCKYQTTFKQNLKRHNICHQRAENSQNPLPTKQFMQCSKCDKRFSYLNHLRFHERKIHNIGKLLKSSGTRKCPMCSFVSSSKSRDEINNHLQTTHDLPLIWEYVELKNMKDFKQWKVELEKNTHTSYITKNNRNTIRRKFYSCHRSGSFKSKTKNIRKVTKESCKINGYCPSEIKVFIQDDGSVNVQYLPTHFGHTNELKHLRLSKDDRRLIARSLANNIPHKEILDEIRCSSSDMKQNRLHLATKKDILNIQKSFDLNDDTIEHHLDSVSVDVLVENFKKSSNTAIEAWVNKIRKSPDTALLIYKPYGETSTEYPELLKNDFLLIYQTTSQNSLLNKYGQDTICFDATQVVYNYNITMYTLLVLDETRGGFPVAFMFSNREDSLIMTLFIEQLKDVSGTIKPNVFMSDIEETFYACWTTVMGSSNLRLYCSWHVLRDWQANIGKINSLEKRAGTNKLLKTLLYELDQNNFQQMLEAARSELFMDEDTLEFSKYFEEFYVKDDRYKQWAYCYRANACINTNMSLDSFNKVLKYFYMMGKEAQGLDKALGAILNLISDRLIELLKKIKQAKVSSKLRALVQRHKFGLRIPENSIIEREDHWQVLSTETEVYSVKKVKTCNNCQLKCSHCNSCFHEYMCSCVDHGIKNNMCKHIHAIARNFQSTLLQIDSDNVCDDWIMKVEEEIELGHNMSKEITHEKSTITAQEHKKIFTEKLQDFMECVHKNVTSVQQMEFVENKLHEIMKTLEEQS